VQGAARAAAAGVRNVPVSECLLRFINKPYLLSARSESDFVREIKPDFLFPEKVAQMFRNPKAISQARSAWHPF
jgi:hypothetical protein